jgi:phosphatidylserine/phosphatidylglycerophosphate/cardiolipin synthase-like enzyme
MEIFISYRRADSEKLTGRIYEKLIAAFGERGVFRDVDDILAGRDFPSALRSITKNCNVMLVIIGSEWTRMIQERSTNPEDWVRLEVETGLNRKDILVIPVLANDVAMAGVKELPDVLQNLPRRNGVRVSEGESFDRDVENLIKTINDVGYKRISGNVSTSFSLYADLDRDERILARLSKGAEVTLLEYNRDETWAHLLTKDNVDGWAAMEDFTLITEESTQEVREVSVGKGFGAKGNAWQLYFTSPTGERSSDGEFGIDVRLADAITRSKLSLDIAAFEFDNKVLTEAILDAKGRNLRIRVVTDKKMGLGGKTSTLYKLVAADIPVVPGESISSLMHNKFMILDGKTIWTGSWNYTEGSTYRNNENTLVFNAPEIASLYLDQFEDMFTRKKFGRKAANDTIHKVEACGTLVEVCFTPNKAIESYLADLIGKAKKSVHFMMYLFRNDVLEDAMIASHKNGVKVVGLLEKKTNRDNRVGRIAELQKAGVPIRFGDNKFFLHHKTILIDKAIAITGSMNLTQHALQANNENVIIVHDPLLANVYLEEFNRMWKNSIPST